MNGDNKSSYKFKSGRKLSQQVPDRSCLAQPRATYVQYMGIYRVGYIFICNGAIIATNIAGFLKLCNIQIHIMHHLKGLYSALAHFDVENSMQFPSGLMVSKFGI